MNFDEFEKLPKQDQMMTVIRLVVDARKEGHSWEVSMATCKEALLFAIGALKALGRQEAVESVLIKMVLQAYEAIARKELGEE